MAHAVLTQLAEQSHLTKKKSDILCLLKPHDRKIPFVFSPHVILRTSLFSSIYFNYHLKPMLKKAMPSNRLIAANCGHGPAEFRIQTRLLPSSFDTYLLNDLGSRFLALGMLLTKTTTPNQFYD